MRIVWEADATAELSLSLSLTASMAPVTRRAEVRLKAKSPRASFPWHARPLKRTEQLTSCLAICCFVYYTLDNRPCWSTPGKAVNLGQPTTLDGGPRAAAVSMTLGVVKEVL
jgi:hypothetical protein